MKTGPLPLSDLLQRLGEDRINLDTLVWQPGWKEWQKLTDVEEIRTQVLNVLPEQRRRVPPPLPTSSTFRSANPAPDIPVFRSTASSAEALYPQARPWIRFWARLFDMGVLTLLFGPVLGFILFPERVITIVAQGMLAMFVWAFVEPAFLTFFGTSPGKKLMRIKLSVAGGSISYGRALLRSLRVWLWGLGAGLPLVWILCAGLAGSKLQRNGVTSWDRKGGFVVSHQPVGWLRGLSLAFAFFAFFVLNSVGTSMLKVGRQVGKESAIQQVYEESVAAGAPTGFMDARWLMPMSEVRALIPSALEIAPDSLRTEVTVFGRTAFVNLVFSNDLMTMVIVSFMTGNSQSTYSRTQAALEREYGTFPRPTRTADRLLKTRKEIGQVAIDHILYEHAGVIAEQVVYYRTKASKLR